MSKNFSDFTFEKTKSSPKEEPKVNVNETSDQQEKIKQTYDSLKGLDSSELAKKLAEEVGRQKSEGSFDYNLLSQSVESMRAFLPTETYQNLKKLLENLR